jgi:hypothetical protein
MERALDAGMGDEVACIHEVKRMGMNPVNAPCIISFANRTRVEEVVPPVHCERQDRS